MHTLLMICPQYFKVMICQRLMGSNSNAGSLLDTPTIGLQSSMNVEASWRDQSCRRLTIIVDVLAMALY